MTGEEVLSRCIAGGDAAASAPQIRTIRSKAPSQAGPGSDGVRSALATGFWGTLGVLVTEPRAG
jgi:hypothetical protein